MVCKRVRNWTSGAEPPVLNFVKYTLGFYVNYLTLFNKAIRCDTVTEKQVSLSGIMDFSKRRRKRKRTQEHSADEFVEVNVPLLAAAEEAIDNSQPIAKGNDRGHVNAEGYHGEVLFDPPNPNDVAEQSDELESNGSRFLEASLSPVTNNSTENETQLLDEWLKNDNRDRNLSLDSRDPDFDELWSYICKG